MLNGNIVDINPWQKPLNFLICGFIYKTSHNYLLSFKLILYCYNLCDKFNTCKRSDTYNAKMF